MPKLLFLRTLNLVSRKVRITIKISYEVHSLIFIHSNTENYNISNLNCEYMAGEFIITHILSKF
jgi:hypothetical protein